MSYDIEAKQRIQTYRETKRFTGVMREATELIGNEIVWYLQTHTKESIDDQVKEITQQSIKYVFMYVVFFHHIEESNHIPVYFADTGMLELAVEMDPDGFTIFDTFASTFLSLSRMEEYFRIDEHDILNRVKFRNQVLHEVILLLAD